MSAVIHQMVLRKRAVKAQIEADIIARDAIIAAARGAKGDKGDDGRGISKLDIEGGELVVTYTDKKKQKVGKVMSERVVVMGGGSSHETLVPIQEEQLMYAKRVDFITEKLFYKGEAVPGSLAGNPAWRIVRTTIGVDDDVTEEWANGSAEFVHVWSDRETYTYI